jgi:Zn-dependent protease
MFVNGFYPVSLTSLIVLSWEYSLTPLSTFLLLAVMCANVAVHEFGHAAVACWTGGNVNGLVIAPWYGRISLEQDDRLAFAMIALAGPVAGIVAGSTALCVLGQVTSTPMVTTFGVSLCGILWAGICDNCLNLLPVWVLDGSQFVKALQEWRKVRRTIEHPMIERPWTVPETPTPPPPVEAFMDAVPSRTFRYADAA